MVSRRVVAALVLVQLSAFALVAQQSAEFGRGNGGEIVVKPKSSARLSGSLGVSTGPSFGMTAGGTLVDDRLWFFGSASRQSSTRFADLELPANATSSAIAARIDGQIADDHAFSAYFEAARRPEFATSAPSPSSFLSLRYTGIVSNNVFFNASAIRNTRQAPGLGILPAE